MDRISGPKEGICQRGLRNGCAV
uniref:Uncharacterized protein n=1 Tax=Anguilla anguilla TaxID=7936 RepID=A0A0E9VVQ6_ANGAN